MKRLFIAEKPALANDVKDALNGNFIKKDGFFESEKDIITWCYGHVIESVPPEGYNADYKVWSLQQLPLKMFPLKYQPKESAAHQVNVILSLLKRDDVTSICHTGDNDEEGQILIDEILIFSENKKPVKRLLINDNTLPAVKKAIENIKDNADFKGISNKALARQVADQIYGMSMSRAYTIHAKEKGYSGVLSVGRVQTPVLGLIVKRFKENRDHTASFYYNVTTTLSRKNSSITFSAKLKPVEGAPVDEKNRIIDESYAKTILDKLSKVDDAEVTEAKTETKYTSAPLPFNLVRLQQFMNRKHKMTAQKTLDITQGLREKFKAITYNRSDCSYLSDDQHSEAPQTIEALRKIFTHSLDLDASRKSSAFNSSKITAHTAIIPTAKVPDLSALNTDEKIVYLAIAEHYLAQFMPKKEYLEATAAFSAAGESFSCRATKIVGKGFTELLATPDSEDSEDSDLTEFDELSQLETGQNVTQVKPLLEKSQTKPAQLFTEASLLAALVRIADFVSDPEIKKLLKDKDADKKDEHGGIGTPATRAAILETLKKRNYVTDIKGKLIPTDAGITLIDSLPSIATEPDLTALWSEQQNEIESGNITVEQFIDELYIKIAELLTTSKIGDLSLAISGGINAKCPSCDSGLKDSPKTLSCTNTSCSFTLWKTQYQKVLTDAQIESLLTKGETPLIKGFKSKADKLFDAKLKLSDTSTGKTEPVFNQIECPSCGSICRMNEKGLFCSASDCMKLWRVVAQKKLTDSQLTALATKGKTPEIKGFTKKTGGTFDAIVTYDKESKKTGFTFNNKK